MKIQLRTLCSMVLLISAQVVAWPAQAAGFDCAKAATRVEKIICANPTLSKLDDKLNEDFKHTISKATAEQKQALLKQERHWIKYTRGACKTEPCFKHAYWSRMAELETFYDPHSPLYKHASDKAPIIKKILEKHKAEFVRLSSSKKTIPNFCEGIIDDLGQLKNIRFIDPIVQTMSYESSALDPWKSNSKVKHAANRYGTLNYQYLCEPNLYPGDPEKISSDCGAYYGLPPFKLFILKSFKNPARKRYIFYFDQMFGPMNQDWKKPMLSKEGLFFQLNVPGNREAFAQPIGGIPNYNSIIDYHNEYYFLMLSTSADQFQLDIETVNSLRSDKNQICRWQLE